MRSIALILALVAATAWAKPKESCDDKCEDDKVLCMKLCKERGSAKTLPYCGQACGEGKKSCMASCAKKGKRR